MGFQKYAYHLLFDSPPQNDYFFNQSATWNDEFDACKSNAQRFSFELRCRQVHHERKSFHFFLKTSKILPNFGWISISVVEFKKHLRLMNDDCVQKVPKNLCHSKKVHHCLETFNKTVQNNIPQIKKINGMYCTPNWRKKSWPQQQPQACGLRSTASSNRKQIRIIKK